ncbi:MAG: hypothetical protein DME61_09830 [Verrucomicrobia bacterium]|nr:MAG: hypothetical protein DME61_09830 [Verrucomicrobiota bacterium]PYL68835.1 MAG: hypothetical protein DMF28_05410 [Verrucomicrobiota bacterium]
MKTQISSVLAALLLLCFAFIGTIARAVSPAPDGGYPGGNTAEGQNTLLSLSTGGFNTAVGFLSLRSNAVGQLNTGIGAGTLLANTSDSNTAIGAGALLSNTTGSQNVADGAFALFSNTTASQNTATGFEALFSNTEGHANTANGFEALSSNTTAVANTATGFQALAFNTTGSVNTATGSGALTFNTTGSFNTADGEDALHDNMNGAENTAVGEEALLHNVDAVNNTAVGFQALTNNISGVANTAVGFSALINNTGDFNIALGNNAGLQLTTGSANIDIGNGGVAGESNTTRIGSVQTKTFIAGIRGVTTINNNAMPVLIDSAGQLGTASSSRRFKTDIEHIDKASESILALKPVSFRYKVHKDTAPQFGLIAEDVAEVNPNLVIYDADGKPYAVRYEAVNAMLLNEFLKAHRKMEEQQKEIDELRTQLKRQAAVIQRVTDRLEVRAATSLAVNSEP